MNLLNLSALILINYRLARLIAKDDGPFDLFLKIRIYVKAYEFDETGTETTSLGMGIKCVHCVGVWTAFFLAIVYSILYHSNWLLFIPIYTFIIAGGQSFLWSLHDS